MRRATSAGKDPPSLPWRVFWWNFHDAHDWIGHHPARGGRLTKTKRAKPPRRHSCDFATREEADAFVANLRRSDDIVAEIRSMRELLPLEPATPPFPDTGLWPRQERRMTGSEWPSSPSSPLSHAASPPTSAPDTTAKRRLREMLEASAEADREAPTRPIS